jgi:hypothetical protein
MDGPVHRLIRRSSRTLEPRGVALVDEPAEFQISNKSSLRALVEEVPVTVLE